MLSKKKGLPILAFFLLLALLPAAAQQIAPARIEGIVVDGETGNPIAGVTVFGPIPSSGLSCPGGALICQDAIGQAPRRRPQGSTGVDGLFSFEIDPGRNIPITAVRSGYTSKTARYSVIANQTTKDILIKLGSTGVLFGRVFDGKGNPLPNIMVTAYYYRTFAGGRRKLTSEIGVETNDRGEYRMMNLPPREYVIGFSPSPAPTVPLTGGFPSPVSFAFMVDPYVATWRGPRLSIPEHIPNQPSSIPPVLYPGASKMADAELVEVGGNKEVRLRDVAISTQRLGRVRIRLSNRNSQLVRDLRISFFARTPQNDFEGGGAIYEQIRLEPGSEVARTFWPVLLGDVGVRLTGGGMTVPIEKFVSFTGEDADLDVDVANSTGQLKVRAMHQLPDDSVVPLAGESIFLSSLDPLANCQTVGPLRTAADGTATIKEVPVGRYEVRITTRDLYLVRVAQGNVESLKDGVLASEDSSSTVDLVVRTGRGQIQGKVMNREGQAFAGGLVVFMSESSGCPVSPEIHIDQGGLFEWRDAPPGRYLGYAWSDPDSPYRDSPFLFEFKDKGKLVSIQEKEQGTVTLQILDGK